MPAPRYFAVRLRHGTGAVRVRLMATSADSARQQALSAELAPASAVLSVRELCAFHSDRDAAPDTGEGTPFRPLCASCVRHIYP